jgi:hypothetical protein
MSPISPSTQSSIPSSCHQSSCADLPEELSLSHGLEEKKSEDNYIVRSCVSLILWGSSLLIAILFDNLGTVLALTGALAASFLGFVIPGVLYLKAHETQCRHLLGSFQVESNCYEPDMYTRLISLKEFYIPGFMIIFGGALCLLGIFTVISE